MNLFHFAIISSLIFACAIAESGSTKESCGSVDYRASLGPVRDQGDIGWCYANAAADLLTYRYRELLNGKHVSAVYVALTNARYMPFLPITTGGFIEPAAFFSQVDGFCPQELDEQVAGENGFDTLKEKISHLRDLKMAYDRSRKGGTLQVGFASSLDELVQSSDVLRRIGRERILLTLEKSSWFDFPRKFAKMICGGDVIYPSQMVMPKTQIKLSRLIPASRLVTSIDRELNRGNIVGMGFHSSFLTRDGRRPIFSKDLHAAVIVGRQWDESTNSCDYIVRNSWGSSCDGYSYLFQGKRCQEGNLLVRQKDLQKNILAIDYLPLR